MEYEDILTSLLKKYKINLSVDTLLEMWNEPHRSYHSESHLVDIIDMIFEDKEQYTEREFELLLLTALFHDCIYNPEKNDNEEKSAQFLVNNTINITDDIWEVYKMILDTKDHQSNDELSNIFINYDMDITSRNIDLLIEWEKGIREEYSMYSDEMYKMGRLTFLNSLISNNTNDSNLMKLIKYVENKY